jgi:hypothetical protein
MQPPSEAKYSSQRFMNSLSGVYRSAQVFQQQFPARLQSAGPRVVKQNRGNGGQGVWKVKVLSVSDREHSMVCVLHARRGSIPEHIVSIGPPAEIFRLEDFFDAHF